MRPLDDDDDPATCRGRAVHARLAAEEARSADFKRIFGRLAELYDAKADALESIRQPKTAAGGDASFGRIEDSSPDLNQA
jgi:hypothetical protein